MSAVAQTLVEWAEAATVHGVQYVFTAGQVRFVLIFGHDCLAELDFLQKKRKKKTTIYGTPSPKPNFLFNWTIQRKRKCYIHSQFQHFLERLFWVLVCLAGIALATFFSVQVALLMHPHHHCHQNHHYHGHLQHNHLNHHARIFIMMIMIN